MEMVKKDIQIKKKIFFSRIYMGDTPEFIFVTHHGMLSNHSTFKYFEEFIGEKGIVISYDARNGMNKLRASRMSSTYARDLNDVIEWARKEFPNLRVVTLGSSWGAAVVIQHAKMFPNSIYKSIAWSVPFNMFGSGESKKAVEVSKTSTTIAEKPKFKETTPSGYAWRFALMLAFNINTKSYTKVDLNKTVNNKVFNRLEALNKPKPVPVKLFYACYKSVIMSGKYLKKIAKRKDTNMYYIQSTVDSYLTDKKLAELKNFDFGSGVKIDFVNEGRHALHWEKENDVNIKLFNMIIDFIKKG